MQILPTIEILTFNIKFMGFGKKWKRFAGSIGKAVGEATGSEFLGRSAATLVGAPMSPTAGSSGYSGVERQQTQARNAIEASQQNQAVQQEQKAQIAEQTRGRLLAEEDIRKMIEEEKKRTTFAGASMQGISERRRLLGV